LWTAGTVWDKKKCFFEMGEPADHRAAFSSFLRRRRGGKFRCRVSGLVAFWRADTSGVAATEFAFIALPFFGILVAIFQIGLVFLAQNELETAVERSARELLTGQAQQGGVTQAQFASTICSYLPVFFTCSAVMFDAQVITGFSSANTAAPTLTYNAQGQVTNSWAFNTGSAGSIVVLRVFYQFPVIPGPLRFTMANLSNGSRLLLATSVFQVEPYAPSGS
jgi:Flp pilus assembly protein TadG